MTDTTLPPLLTGGSSLRPFAEYVGQPLGAERMLSAAPRENQQYVIVHMYLVPGDVTRRPEIQRAIQVELKALKALPLHSSAFAVPCCRGDERATAEEVWNRLMFAGAAVDPQGQRDAWEEGDVIYIHYVADSGIAVLAVAPTAGQRLPNLAD